MTMRLVDAVIVGGGQAGLATGFYLRRAGMRPGEDCVIVDAADGPGGAWSRMWEGLRLFSPASFSSLPGWRMPDWDDAERGYPPRTHAVDYLTRYEDRYDLDVLRPHRVRAVTREDADPRGRLLVHADGLTLAARTVVSTTGTWDQPFWPTYPGMRAFAGRQLHAADYREPGRFAGQHVVIVGGGSSAAQVLAEVYTVAQTTWVTTRPPRFHPDDVDGRVLFTTARERIHALAEGRAHSGVAGVRGCRHGRLGSRSTGPWRAERTADVRSTHPSGVAWADGRSQQVDSVIWCTGFRPALRHLYPLGLRNAAGHVAVGGRSGTQVPDEPRLYLVGYGDWTGPASATLAGVGPSAKATAAAMSEEASTGSHTPDP